MRSIWKAVPTFGVFALMLGNTANAADMGGGMEPPPLLQNAPLLVDEFSSGWYLRGDVGYRWNNLDGVSNNDPPPGVRSSDLDSSWLVGAGIGYKWEWFRTDVTLDYGSKSDFSADSRFRTNDFTGNIDTVTGLVNVYGDLGTWYGFTPYLGVGVGFAHLQAANFNVASAGGAIRDGDSAGSWNFAWAYMAGISYRMMGNYHIDLGYRHVNMGDVTTGRDGLGNQLSLNKVSSDEVRLGFRYVLD